MKLLIVLVALAHARRQAVYSSNYTTAYILENSSLYSLQLSGSQESSSSLEQELKQIKPPGLGDPALAIDAQDILYAVSGTSCQTPIQIQAYNASSDSWSSLPESPASWYRPNSTCWYEPSSNSILIYGGLFCNGSISSSFYNYSITSSTWAEATAATMPREMAYGQVISTSKDSAMIVGGRTNSGWLSMQQVAVWQYGGWSYFSVDNYSSIDSRDDPYLLPLWNNSESTVSSIIVVGGTVAGRNATPEVALMNFNSSIGWNWASTDLVDSGLMASVYGAVYSGSNKAIYGTTGQTLKTVAPQALASTSTPQESKGLNKSGIAAVSTIVPLVVLIAAVIGAWVWWRKRKQRRTFLPRQSQIIADNQSLDLDDNFPDFRYPPVRHDEKRLIDGQGHKKGPSHQEYEQNDVHFVSHRISSNLRVVNPDFDSSSLSSVGTLGSGTRLIKDDAASQSSVETVGQFYHNHRATASRDITSMHSSMSSLHSRSSSRSDEPTRPSQRIVSGASKFDFE